MAQDKPVKIAVIGCGIISSIYLKNLCDFFHITDVVGCADLIELKAKKCSEEHNIRQMNNRDILEDPEIEIVVNLTDPQSHYEVTRSALEAGKHVYSEKMAAVELKDGEALLQLAREKELCYTVAPDTFLGGGLQTARWVIDSGLIGEPILVNGLCQRAYRLDRGDDEIRMIHKPGGGIPFDMGGYYLHAFVNMFGPIDKVSGFTKTHNSHRAFLNPHSPLYKEPYTETCINTITAVLQFENGVLGSLSITSEGSNGGPQKIEVVGTEGTLFIHNPNDFFGEIRVKRENNPEPMIIPYTHPFCESNFRGLGVADMAYAMRNGRVPRADAALGLHALEIIHRVWESTTSGETYTIRNRVNQPKAMPQCGFSGPCAEFVLDH